MKAHRFSWFLHKGPVADGVLIRHLCNNPPCVNPAHLAEGDCLENSADMMRAGRCAMVRIPYATVLEIRERYRPGRVGYRKIAAEFGILPGHVRRYVKMQRRKYVEPTEGPSGL